MNPNQLSTLLTSLSSNEKEYNKYMSFKKNPIPKQFEEIALMSYTHPNAACRLCAYAEHMKDVNSSTPITDNKNNNDDTLDMKTRISNVRNRLKSKDTFVDRARKPNQRRQRVDMSQGDSNANTANNMKLYGRSRGNTNTNEESKMKLFDI